MFAAGVLGASWLWVLVLVVARFYGTWRRWDGWVELRLDMLAVGRALAGTPFSASGHVGAGAIGAMLGWSAAWAAFLYALSS